METITLNDGTVLNGHILNNGDGRLIFVYLDGKSLAEGFLLFSDQSKTIRITENNHGNEHVYENYTEITSINSEFGNCNLTLRKVTQ